MDLDLSEIYFFCQITNHHNLCIADYAQDNISSDMDRTDAGGSFRHRRNVRTGDAVFAAVGLAVAAGVIRQENFCSMRCVLQLQMVI